MPANIHPAAFVDPGAKLADNVVIGPCAFIDKDVEIGEGCRIDAFASIKQYTRIGKNNHIFSYAMVGEVPQDLKFHGERSWLEIGDSNNIREFSTLHRGTETGAGTTRIGSGCLLMAYTHVAHDCEVGNGVIMSNNATLAGHVQVGDYAIIGGLSAVHQFVRIGTHAFLGGMSGAPQDVPPYMLAVGTRAEMHGPNLVGLRRMGLSKEAIGAVKSVYKLLWLSGVPRQEALEKAAQDYAAFPEAMEIVKFVRESKRGTIIPKRGEAQDNDQA